MQNLKISLVQTKLIWEDAQANRDLIESKIASLKNQTDIIILPEMFSTGFTMNASNVIETMDGSTVNWMRTQAALLNSAICGSIIIKENGNHYNRFIWMEADGNYQTYDKRHLFTLAGEHEHYTAGTEKKIFNYRAWKICPMVCYDLRFPVWSRNSEQYDLLIYVANWPNKRSHAWKALLQARAIENQSYTVGVNRVGKDENDLHYSGDSRLVDYAGFVQYQLSEVEGISTIELDFEKQQNFRNKLAFLDDQDTYKVIL